MSHFRVMVITDDLSKDNIDSIMKPYDEHLEVAEYISRTAAEFENIVRSEYADVRKRIKKVKPHRLSIWEKYLALSYRKSIKNKMRIYSELFDKKIDKDYNLITTYNPNAKWDWRTNSSFSIIFGDWIYFEDDELDDEEKMLHYEDGFEFMYVKDIPIDYVRRDKTLINMWNKINDKDIEYYVDENIAEFANQCKNVDEFIEGFDNTYGFRPWAIVYNGEWISPGDVGWFGSSDETEESKSEYEQRYKEILTNPENANLKATILDCHI